VRTLEEEGLTGYYSAFCSLGRGSPTLLLPNLTGFNTAWQSFVTRAKNNLEENQQLTRASQKEAKFCDGFYALKLLIRKAFFRFVTKIHDFSPNYPSPFFSHLNFLSFL
jgi:hypothetical protein